MMRNECMKCGYTWEEENLVRFKCPECGSVDIFTEDEEEDEEDEQQS